MAHLLISAAHKSSGKTTVSIGLCAALARRGVTVQPFKKGPDYIDPMWLGAAAGRPCHNLDFFLQSSEEIRAAFAARSHDADLALVEGNKGLYDGLDLDGSNSNAALARVLHAPVILVLDARGMTRGIAPLILGYQAFDPGVNLAGVILNCLGGRRHESKLRAVIEHYTSVPVLGAIQADPALVIPERHLGLVPSNEDARARTHIDAMADAVARQVDLDRVLAVAATAPDPRAPGPQAVAAPGGPPVRLGILRDAAFGFYYPADLEALERAGAQLVPVDALRDQRLPPLDGLFIGGGFPEVHMQALEANTGLRSEVRAAVERGLPVYAECGGLMYLARGIQWRDRHAAMAGALPLDIRMHDRPQGRGYVRLRETGQGPWPLNESVSPHAEFPAHEFHYSAVENAPADLNFAYQVLRGHGIDGKNDGIVYRNTLASYCHLRHVRGNPWTERFVAFIRARRDTGHTALRAPARAAKV